MIDPALGERLRSLDAMRGVGILAMMPFHLVFFGQIFTFSGEGGISLVQAMPFPIEFRPPMATGLVLFSFVTGMSLAFFASQEKSKFSLLAGVIRRYGTYTLVGILFEILLWTTLKGPNIDYGFYFSFIVGGYGSFSAPLTGLSLSALIAFPLILYLPWKKIIATAVGIALSVGLVLYYFLITHPYDPEIGYLQGLPEFSLLNPLLIGMFAALKGVPIVLVGAVIGKSISARKNILKKKILIGSAIVVTYMIVPAFFGTFMIQFVLAIWAYPYAITFVIGSSLLLFSLLQICEDKKINLVVFEVLGRVSFFAYFGHFLLLLPLIEVIGFANMNLGYLLGLMVISEIVVWILSYRYCKWKWGSPSNW